MFSMVLPLKYATFSAKERADHDKAERGFGGLFIKKKIQLQQTEPHVCLLDRNFNFIYCNRNCKFRKLMVTA